MASKKKQDKQPTERASAKAQMRKRSINALGSTRVKDRGFLSDKMKSSTRRKLFLQATVFDFILVLLVSVTLTYTISYGFHSAWDYRSNVLLITGLTIPILLVLFAGSWSKKAIIPSAIGTLVLAVVYIAVSLALSSEPFFTEDAAVNDVEGCYGIFAIIVVAVPIVVFLLSRRTAGLVALIVLASVCSGFIQFLYRDWITEQPGIPVCILMLFGLGMLFVYQCYRQSIYSANRVKNTSFIGAFAFSAIICGVCVAVGAGVFYGVIQASNLTTPEIKLFEEYVSPPVTDEAHDYEKMDDKDSDKTSDEAEDQEDEAGEGEGNDSPNVEQGTSMLESTLVGQLASIMAGVDPDQDDPEDEEDLNKYMKALQYMWIIIACLVALLIFLIVMLWRYRRTWRLKHIAKRSKSYQVYYLYNFLIERFRRVRIVKPAHLTPFEFAAGFSKALLPYTRDTEGVTFLEVASVYQDAVYGGIEPTDLQMERIRLYYRRFYRNAFKETPWPKWIFWRFWRL